MRTILFAAVIAVAGAGCSKSADKPAATAKAQPPTVSVDEVDHLLAQHQVQPIDCNGEGTRKKMGVLPGALLLSDSEELNISELPADRSKTLVFYCANQHCGASHEAAAKALTAGYTNVKVMPDGIAGWVKAGKKTQQI